MSNFIKTSNINDYTALPNGLFTVLVNYSLDYKNGVAVYRLRSSLA